MSKTKTRAPMGMSTTREEVPGYGMITFCVVDNREPERLPWYKNASKIPADMLAEAEAVARELSEDDKDFEFYMMNWRAAVTGWSYAVRLYYPWFMQSPKQAIAWMRSICNHKWGERRDHTAHDNYILGTYDRGYKHTCSRCGKEEYVTTSFNNYSGD